eukprot:1148913-Pelagomonas_calceolata.AAC.3
MPEQAPSPKVLATDAIRTHAAETTSLAGRPLNHSGTVALADDKNRRRFNSYSCVSLPQRARVPAGGRSCKNKKQKLEWIWWGPDCTQPQGTMI